MCYPVNMRQTFVFSANWNINYQSWSWVIVQSQFEHEMTNWALNDLCLSGQVGIVKCAALFEEYNCDINFTLAQSPRSYQPFSVFKWPVTACVICIPPKLFTQYGTPHEESLGGVRFCYKVKVKHNKQQLFWLSTTACGAPSFDARPHADLTLPCWRRILVTVMRLHV